MSNQATIQPTVFQNHGTEDKTFGVRVYDNYGQTYDNTWGLIADDDMEIFALCMESDDEVIVGIIEFIQEHGRGVTIGQEYYEWDQIKHLFGV